MSRLHDLYREHGQSPWLDNLRRGWIMSGELERWVERGVRGITSNPSIFQKAMGEGEDYDEEFSASIAGGYAVADSYWYLATSDISDPSASCGRCSTRAAARTATCHSRLRPRSLATPPAPRPWPDDSTNASPSQTCT